MGLLPPDTRSLCPLSSTEFVEPPPETKFLGMPLVELILWYYIQTPGTAMDNKVNIP